MKAQQQSEGMKVQEMTNTFHTAGPLGGRREDKEVSHVVYCCAGKWLMVTDEQDGET